MNECRRIHPMLSQYLEGELPSKEKRLVAWHLNQCSAARKELYEVERLRKRLADMPEPPFPARLHERIMDAVFRPQLAARAAEEAPDGSAPRPFLPRFLLKPAWGLAAAAVLVIALFNMNPDWMRSLSSAGHSLFRSERQAYEDGGTDLSRADLESTPVQGFPAEEAPEEVAGGLPGTEPTTVPAKAEAPKAPVSKASVPADAARAKAAAPAAFEASREAAAPAPVAKRAEPRNVKEGLAKALSAARKAGAKSPTPAPAAAGLEPVQALGADSAAEAPVAARASAPAPEPAAGGLPRWSGANARAAVETQELIIDAQTLRVYWTLLNPGEPPPPVDFDSQAVVVLVAEQKPTAGWRIVVDRLEEAPSNLVVWYREESPEAEAFVAQVVTRPWTLQVVPKPSKPVVFKKKD
jgi:hypothetical protein